MTQQRQQLEYQVYPLDGYTVNGITKQAVLLQNYVSPIITQGGGITTTNPTELEKSIGQPDGSLWYKCFDTKEGFAEYFGNYLNYFEEDGIKDAVTIREYAEALKHGGYFGDTIDNYAQGMKDVELRCFA